MGEIIGSTTGTLSMIPDGQKNKLKPIGEVTMTNLGKVTIKPTSNFSQSRLGGKDIQTAEILHGPAKVACFPDELGIYIRFLHNGHTRWIPEHGDKHWLILSSKFNTED